MGNELLKKIRMSIWTTFLVAIFWLVDILVSSSKLSL